MYIYRVPQYSVFASQTSVSYRPQHGQTEPTKDLCAQLWHRSAWTYILIRVFAICMKKPWVLGYPLSTQRRLVRLGGCPGWSESSLGAQVIFFFFFFYALAHFSSSQNTGVMLGDFCLLNLITIFNKSVTFRIGHSSFWYKSSVCCRSVRVAERLALPTSDDGVAGSNPAGGKILPETKQRFIAQSLSCSHFHRLKMTEILLKGCKTLTHPSIHQYVAANLLTLFLCPKLHWIGQ